MRNFTLLLSIAFLFLGQSSLLFAQNSVLAEHYKKALTPKISESPVHTTRGFGGTKKQHDQYSGEEKQPSLTMHLEFGFNSDKLTSQTVKYLDELGKALQDPGLRSYIFRIEGHTDNVGSDAYNVQLSRKRAIAVTDYIVNNFALEKQQFDVEGYGMNSPIASNNTEEGRAQNRRVVVVNTLKRYAFTLSNRPDIIVKVKKVIGTEEGELHKGETLTQQDSYAIEFTPKSSAYVYIYQIDTRGKIETLFPNPEFSQSYNLVDPGKFYRIPGVGKWLFLDNNKGEEHIVVIAQKEELKDPVAICRREISNKDILTASVDPIPARSAKTAQTRGLAGMREDIAEEENIQQMTTITKQAPASAADMSGIFVWKTTFVHQ